jgi:hypothetical protein
VIQVDDWRVALPTAAPDDMSADYKSPSNRR